MRILRLVALDTYQVRMPRARMGEPVTIVAVDEASLQVYGQWPWPRTRLAELVDRIAARRPLAIALDFVMPEPDRLSPRRLVEVLPDKERALIQALSRMEDGDARLARSFGNGLTVLAVGGLETPGAAAAGTITQAPILTQGDPLPFLRHFQGALRSLDRIHNAAAGHGLISVDPEGGVVRRLPLVAAIGNAIVPGFAVETLRVGIGAPALSVTADTGGVKRVTVGEVDIPTEADGTVWVRFSPHVAGRFVSARDVLAGRVEAARFEQKLVLIGITTLGVSDYQATPVDDRMAGVEIHAQLIEAIYDGALLRSPRWLRGVEAAGLLAGGLLLIMVVPRISPRWAFGLLVLLVATVVLVGFGLYLNAGLLFDFLTPTLALGFVFTAMLAGTLVETERQRRALREEVEVRREAAARLEGELEGARRIQMGLLPSPAAALAGESRVSVWAFLAPAREVGGDLYDFFRLDGDRMFFMVGDVSGKGLPASLFMAFTKSVCRSAALRRGDDAGQTVAEVNRELTRENREGLYVTLVAVILDARTGRLHYCAAGHDAPYILGPGRGTPGRLAEGGGLPVGIDDDAGYQAGAHVMVPGESVCLMTDGVTDAAAASGEFYGRQRLEAVLATIAQDAAPSEVGEAVRDSVNMFAAGEAADDIAIVVIRWNGPG